MFFYHLTCQPLVVVVNQCNIKVEKLLLDFFFDGEDGQQPVIFGTLFKQPFIEDGLKNSDVQRKETNLFCTIHSTKCETNMVVKGHQGTKKVMVINGGNGNSLTVVKGNVVKHLHKSKKKMLQIQNLMEKFYCM